VTNMQIEGSVQLVREIGKNGTSILIFVAGMAEIVEVCSRLEALQGGNKRYKVIPIHSDLPDEEQAEAFVTELEVLFSFFIFQILCLCFFQKFFFLFSVRYVFCLSSDLQV
jgi:hypothetical protein